MVRAITAACIFTFHAVDLRFGRKLANVGKVADATPVRCRCSFWPRISLVDPQDWGQAAANPSVPTKSAPINLDCLRFTSTARGDVQQQPHGKLNDFQFI